MTITCKSPCEKGGQLLDVVRPVNRARAKQFGFLSWWKAFGTGGNTVRDLLRLGNGTLTSGAVHRSTRSRPGGYGTWLFDATNDHVLLPASPTFFVTLNQPFTVMWWENIVSTTGAFPSRVRLAVSGGASAMGIVRSSNATYQHLAVFGNGAAGPAQRASDAPSIASSVGIWNFFAVVGLAGPMNNTGSNWRFYCNRNLLTTAAGSTGTYSNNTINRFGYDGIDDGANCYLDDVRICKKALSSAEIRSIRKDDMQGNPTLLNWIEDDGHMMFGDDVNRRRRLLFSGGVT